jgi:hypothetical protein
VLILFIEQGTIMNFIGHVGWLLADYISSSFTVFFAIAYQT